MLIARWKRWLAEGEGENGEPEAVRRAVVDWEGVLEKPSVYRDVESGEEE